MRILFCLGLLSLAGCATSHQHSQFSDDDEAAEDRKFFYGEMWRAAPSDTDEQDKRFFYGGSPRR